MRMFKITKVQTWNKNGIPTNWIKYMKSETIENVIKHFGLDNILKVEQV